MKRVLLLLIGILTLSASAHEIVGYWKGDVMSLPIVFHVVEKGGGLSVTLDSPMQGAKDIPCESIELKGDSVVIKIPLLQASFKGVFETDENSIRGIFKQGVSVPLLLTRTTEEASKLYRPQEPKPPFVYNSREVTFGHDGITLAGTLTTPMWGNHYPAVVLVTGSGAQNRDEEILGHKPFAVIADYLTRAGFAVLRYDDRGVGGSTKGNSDDTTLDYATDAIAAIEFLKKRSVIDSTRIGVIGHSEGGTIAFICAAQRPDDVAFVVSLGGVVVKGKELMVMQNKMIAEATGRPLSEELEQNVVAVFDAIDSIEDKDKLSLRLTELMATQDNLSEAEIANQVKHMVSPWYSAFVRFNPIEYIKQMKCPVLALNGEWDVQVNARQNLDALKTVYPDAEIKTYSGVNHMFQEASSLGQSLNYGAISQTFSPKVLDDIAKWMVKITAKK